MNNNQNNGNQSNSVNDVFGMNQNNNQNNGNQSNSVNDVFGMNQNNNQNNGNQINPVNDVFGMNQNNNSKTLNSKNTKGNLKFDLGKLIKIFIIFLIIGFIIYFGFKIINNIKEKNNNSGKYFSKVIEVSNSKKISALFNIEGKQLTDFNLKYVDDFYNHSAKVTNLDDQDGIISDTGKMIVDFGKYKYIFKSKYLFECIDSESNSFLINNEGKVIRKLKDDEELLEYKYYESNAGDILVSMDGYIFYDDVGNEIYKLKYDDVIDIPNITCGSYDKCLISYTKKNKKVNNILVNAKKHKKIIEFESNNILEMEDFDDKDDLIILGNRNGFLSREEFEMKIIKNNKLTYESIGKEYHLDEKFNIIEEESYIVDEFGQRQLKLINIRYKDSKNYLKQNDSNVEVYKNGKLVKTIEDISFGDGNEINKYNIFTIVMHKNNNRLEKYIDIEGNIIGDDNFFHAEDLDENERGIVKNLGDHKYFIVDKSGKRLSDYYAKLWDSNSFYLAKVNEDDNEVILLDKDGKEIYKADIKSINYFNGNYQLSIKKDNNFIIYDLKKKKEIINTKNELRFFDNYYFDFDGGKYYSAVTGKMFYQRDEK